AGFSRSGPGVFRGRAVGRADCEPVTVRQHGGEGPCSRERPGCLEYTGRTATFRRSRAPTSCRRDHLMARTILVTGAASGIGKATAELLESAGDAVLRVDLREGDVTGDLSDPEQIDRVAAEIAQRTGGVLDVLVANAGVSAPSELSVRINYLGTVRLIEALRPQLAASDAPRISVTTSAATLQGNDPELVDLLLAGDAEAAVARGAALAAQGPDAGYANYSSSKRAISRWIRRAAPTAEYAGAGIGLNGVGPG